MRSIAPSSELNSKTDIGELGLAPNAIQREVAIINPSKVDRKLVAITEISLHVHDSQQRDQTIRRICELPEVTQCYNITGERDIVIISFLRDMEDFETKISERLNSDTNIAHINTYFVIKTKKFEPFVFLDEGPD